MGLDFRDGVNIHLKRESVLYGIRARSLLLHIVSHMIKHKVKLSDENREFVHPNFPQGVRNFSHSSPIFGWMVALYSVKEI